MHTVKPIDEEAIELAAKQTGAIVTAEEHVLHGGLGPLVAQVHELAEKGQAIWFDHIRRSFIESGDLKQWPERGGGRARTGCARMMSINKEKGVLPELEPTFTTNGITGYTYEDVGSLEEALSHFLENHS